MCLAPMLFGTCISFLWLSHPPVSNGCEYTVGCGNKCQPPQVENEFKELRNELDLHWVRWLMPVIAALLEV
jgi:hypothetical protein